MGYETLSFNLEDPSLWDKWDLSRLRLDEIVELLCRHAGDATTKATGLTLVCDAIEVDRFRASELCVLVARVLQVFLRQTEVRHLLIGLTQNVESVDLTVWGQGLARLSEASRAHVAEASCRLGASTSLRRSSAGAGFSVSVPVCSTPETPHNIH